MNIFFNFAGENRYYNGSIKSYFLNWDAPHLVYRTLIFASGIRHDLDLGSVVMDAYFMAFTKSRLLEFADDILTLFEEPKIAVDVGP